MIELTISETRLLPLLGGEGLDWFQIEVIVEMEIVQVLPVYKEVQHVIPLPADLEPGFNPVKSRRLEELGTLERSEQVSETGK
jgi:hypothetical protein